MGTRADFEKGLLSSPKPPSVAPLEQLNIQSRIAGGEHLQQCWDGIGADVLDGLICLFPGRSVPRHVPTKIALQPVTQRSSLIYRFTILRVRHLPRNDASNSDDQDGERDWDPLHHASTSAARLHGFIG